MRIRSRLIAFTITASLLVACNLYAMSTETVDVTQWRSSVPMPRNIPYGATLKLHVDASDTQRRIIRVKQTIPVKQAGRLTVLYPEWIPGNHRTSGPINKIAGIVFTGNGQKLKWNRDPYNVYAFHVDVPEGVGDVEASFEYLSPTDRDQGRITMTQDMLNLQWNTVALYPAGYYVRQIPIQATVKYPQGFIAATALEKTGKSSGQQVVTYDVVPFDTLLDSPVFAGRYFRQLDLDPGAAIPVRLNIVADSPGNLEVGDDALKAHRELVKQADKVFGSRPYDRYEFLLGLTNQMGGIGLEHHRSSENAHDPDHFTDWKGSSVGRDLLAHEYTHSWDGKYRRGADLTTPDYSTPMGNTLLWVYEGQTQFWGNVLAARSGLVSQAQAMETTAVLASTYADERPGMAWRSIEDTTFDPIINRRQPQPNRGYQMSEDYYSGGQMVWLAVHAKLAELTGERKGIDDFARAFFGGRNGDWNVKTYTFNDVVQTLNAIAPFNWNAFLTERIMTPRSPADSLKANGWTLVYKDKPNDFHKRSISKGKAANFALSLGMNIGSSDSRINNVVWDGPAFNAGLGVGQVIMAVNGMAYSESRLEAAIAAKQPIRLIVRNGEAVSDITIDYRNGLRYPHLERIAGTPDRLTKLFTPR